MKQLTIAAAIFLLAICLGGCFTHRYTLPELKEISRTDPLTDFNRIREFFRQHSGEIVAQDDIEVIWKDTSLFRVYELKHHSIIMFPYNWKQSGFNAILFAGHIKPELNPYDAIHINVDQSVIGAETCSIDGVEWDMSSENLSDVRFNGVVLGQAKEVFLREQTDYIQSHPEEIAKDQVPLRLANLNWFQGHLSIIERDNIFFHVLFENQKVACISAAQRGFATLSLWAIHRPQTPVVAQGRFPPF